MVNKTTKLRWRRRFRRSQHRVENFSVSAEQGLERYFFKRFGHLSNVRRFVLGWVLLVVLLGTGVVMQVRALSPYYQEIQPVDGGIYTEGILGSYTTTNPIYATGSVDSSVSRLIFSGLMKYNSQGELIGDLAATVTPDEKGSTYTATLRDDIFWHDGRRVVADDVIFTYQLIQNPDAKSPLRSNWQGTKFEKKDERTVVFTLPHQLSSFPYLLTTGILPQHLLSSIPPAQLRTVDFNTSSPIGSGPFKWDSIQISGQTTETREEQIGLSANPRYHDGVPKLDRFIVKAVRDQGVLIQQFKGQEVDAIVGLDKMPEEFVGDFSLSEYDIPLNAEVGAFFKSSSPVLGHKAVRQALTKATNQYEIINGLGYAVIAAKGPLLTSHLGYANDMVQFPTNVAEANALLDQNGWVPGTDGIRVKDGVPLTFQLYSRDSSDYAYVSQALQRQWRAIGANAEVILQKDSDLQSTIALHAYDALLYGITLGSDPDVYAYWHSSQADVRSNNRLNFSEFKSKTADSALEGGRTRSDPALRATKYRPFLTAWRDEAPAVALYQPRFLYVTRGKVYGLHSKVITTATDRYANVQNWQIRTERVTIE